MNERIDLEEVATRLTSELGGGIHVGTAYDADFIALFSKTFPAAWVVGQRARPMDDGRGYSGRMRQNIRVEVVIRIIVQKVPATDNVDSRLSSLQNAVSDALIGWKPTNADRVFAWDLAQDGPPHEGAVTADLIFVTQTTYQR